jgi:hypothetical protein
LIEPTNEDDLDGFDFWTWRNCREITLTVHIALFPWQWFIRAEKWDDNSSREFKAWLQFGPIVLSIDADIGNVSSGDWRARFGLSENEAFRRANHIGRST